MHAKLTIKVVYDSSTADATDKNIERLLNFLAEHAASNGMLSGDYDLVVDEWSHTVEVTE